jgi:hypothetical protein
MIAMELPDIVKNTGGLSVPLAPVVVLVEDESGNQSLVKVVGVVGETKVGDQWVFALKGAPVRVKQTLDLG